MSFFGKLKERMFRSSSKLDEGLDALVAAEPAPEAPDAPIPSPAPVVAAADASRPSLLSRLTGRQDAPRRVLDDAFVEELEDLVHVHPHGAVVVILFQALVGPLRRWLVLRVDALNQPELLQQEQHPVRFQLGVHLAGEDRLQIGQPIE